MADYKKKVLIIEPNCKDCKIYTYLPGQIVKLINQDGTNSTYEIIRVSLYGSVKDLIHRESLPNEEQIILVKKMNSQYRETVKNRGVYAVKMFEN